MSPSTRSSVKNSRRTEQPDIIDLTEDSPTNVALRRKRNHSENEDLIIESSSINSVLVADDDDVEVDSENKKRKCKKPMVIINLDDTVNENDNGNKNGVGKSVLQETTNTANLSCPICLENFMESKDLKPMTTPCGHIYCLDCLTKIANSTKVCSMCKRQIKYSRCIRLHI